MNKIPGSRPKPAESLQQQGRAINGSPLFIFQNYRRGRQSSDARQEADNRDAARTR